MKKLLSFSYKVTRGQRKDIFDMVKVKKEVTRSDLSEKAQPSKRKQKSEEYLKYQKYIRSSEFDEVRQIVKERDQICQCCGRTDEDIENNPKLHFNCHHRCYDHLFEGGDVEAADCILLCSVCHRQIHLAKSNFNRFKR